MSGPRSALRTWRAASAKRRRRSPPRVLRPTRAGWCFFALTFGVGFAALNTGNNLLYLVLSLMLAFLVLSGLLSESALRGIGVRRRMPAELYAGTRCSGVLEVHNAERRIPAFAVVVEDLALIDGAAEAIGRCFCLRVGPGQRVVRRYALEPRRRGPLLLLHFRVSTRFPFGLFVKSKVIRAEREALVYPHVDPLALPRRDREGAAFVEARRRRSRDGSLLGGLREFQQGDPKRRIHWRSSLRRGQLLVGEVEGEQCAEIEVLLRTRRAGPAGRAPTEAELEDFERRVSWAASEVSVHLDAGLEVALRTDHDLIAAHSGAGQRARLFGHLARVALGEGVVEAGEPRREAAASEGTR